MPEKAGRGPTQLKAAGRQTKQAGRFALDLLFPRRCVMCEDVLPFSAPWERERAMEAARAMRAEQDGKTAWTLCEEPAAGRARKASSNVCGGLQSRDTAFSDAVPDMAGCHAAERFYYICEACEKTLRPIPEAHSCRKCGRPLGRKRAVPLHNGGAKTEEEQKNTAGESKARRRFEDGSRGVCANRTEAAAPADGRDVPTEEESGASLCNGCRKQVRLFERCICLYPYDERMRRVMADVKYRHNRQYLEALAVLCAEELGDDVRRLSPDAAVPVPVHPKRRRKRGYNQAEEFAKAFALRTCIPLLPHALERRKNTQALKLLGASGRAKGLQNAFFAGSDACAGKTLLLIDDIYTTGATLEACTEALLEAGAARVFGLCICAGEEQFG